MWTTSKVKSYISLLFLLHLTNSSLFFQAQLRYHHPVNPLDNPLFHPLKQHPFSCKLLERQSIPQLYPIYINAWHEIYSKNLMAYSILSFSSLLQFVPKDFKFQEKAIDSDPHHIMLHTGATTEERELPAGSHEDLLGCRFLTSSPH